uniref:Uncharacterized protein n=1 Tax=Leersia perrieri TaxID=77586 RepID=A0A0D9VXH3_9ORYZ
MARAAAAVDGGGGKVGYPGGEGEGEEKLQKGRPTRWVLLFLVCVCKPWGCCGVAPWGNAGQPSRMDPPG